MACFDSCVDDNGDSLKTGYFVLGKGLLKFCNIKDQGWKARIEPRGCFNGTKDDDVEDTRFHVKKYTVWRQGNVDLRCGDNGIHVYRCYVEEKPLYVGSAWIDKNGIIIFFDETNLLETSKLFEYNDGPVTAGTTPISVKMMSAARSAGFRYKKRTPSQTKTQKSFFEILHEGGDNNIHVKCELHFPGEWSSVGTAVVHLAQVLHKYFHLLILHKLISVRVTALLYLVI
uniref:DOMON domain-containing protein n=1 Tax=Heterorhabditis bacteriophora TaxID=37862 RepID=A0A1I7WCN6_HETBA